MEILLFRMRFSKLTQWTLDINYRNSLIVLVAESQNVYLLLFEFPSLVSCHVCRCFVSHLDDDRDEHIWYLCVCVCVCLCGRGCGTELSKLHAMACSIPFLYFFKNNVLTDLKTSQKLPDTLSVEVRKLNFWCHWRNVKNVAADENMTRAIIIMSWRLKKFNSQFTAANTWFQNISQACEYVSNRANIFRWKFETATWRSYTQIVLHFRYNCIALAYKKYDPQLFVTFKNELNIKLR